MKDLIRLVLVVAAGLLVSAASVFGLGDRYILTPPPQNTAERFLDQFAARRHEQALRRVEAGAQGAHMDSLTVWHRQITSCIGRFEVEEVLRYALASDRASVAVRLKGEGDPSAEFRLGLVRRYGSWYVQDLGGLGHAARGYHGKGGVSRTCLNAH